MGNDMTIKVILAFAKALETKSEPVMEGTEEQEVMSSLFDDLRDGLQEAIDFERGKGTLAVPPFYFYRAEDK